MIRPVRGSTHATPGAAGGAEPVTMASTQPAEEPPNRLRRTAGNRRTIARFAAVSTRSQQDLAAGRPGGASQVTEQVPDLDEDEDALAIVAQGDVDDARGR